MNRLSLARTPVFHSACSGHGCKRLFGLLLPSINSSGECCGGRGPVGDQGSYSGAPIMEDFGPSLKFGIKRTHYIMDRFATLAQAPSHANLSLYATVAAYTFPTVEIISRGGSFYSGINARTSSTGRIEIETAAIIEVARRHNVRVSGFQIGESS